MSDLQVLFLALALIYGWECTVWLPRDSVAFRNGWLGRWRLRHPGTLLGNARGGLVVAPMLPPLRPLLLSSQFPASLAADAVLAYVSSAMHPAGRPPQAGGLARFAGIKSIEARRKGVWIDGRLFLRTGSTTYAARVAGELRRLLGMNSAARRLVIGELLHSQFDTAALRRRWEEFWRLARPVRWLSHVLFADLFVLAPGFIVLFGLKRSWLPLLVSVFVLTFATALFFRRAHRRLHPEAHEERFTHCLTIMLSPPSAVRAQDALARPLLDAFHPLAVARVFCPEKSVRRLAGRVVRELRHPARPVCPGDDPEAVGVEQENRERLRRVVESFLEEEGIRVEELLAPPEPLDVACVAYCPRCRNQFTTAVDRCADCGGIELQPLAPGPVARPD